MRRTIGLAAAAVLAAGTIAAQGAAASGAPTQATASQAGRGPAAAAVAALAAHPGAARAAQGQAFSATRTVTDADGTTHVRLDRTYRGLPVLGGDLVVHQGPRRRPTRASARPSPPR